MNIPVKDPVLWELIDLWNLGLDYLMTIRTNFKNAVFFRDNNLCVICLSNGIKTIAVDAHHILDRKLFKGGGYEISNGASVCAGCHILCEKTDISVEKIRKLCKIENPYLPEGFSKEKVYDKWGNEILSDGRRIKGRLFDDGVKKILADKLHLFDSF